MKNDLYVTIDNVFLGNNGANMIKYDEANADGHGEGVSSRTTLRMVSALVCS